MLTMFGATHTSTRVIITRPQREGKSITETSEKKLELMCSLILISAETAFLGILYLRPIAWRPQSSLPRHCIRAFYRQIVLTTIQVAS